MAKTFFISIVCLSFFAAKGQISLTPIASAEIENRMDFIYYFSQPVQLRSWEINDDTVDAWKRWEVIENFSFVPSTIFPCNTEEETALFNLLNKAYSDARYKEDYSIPTEIANLLKKRVHQLLLFAEKLYNKKMMVIQNNRTTTFPLTAADTTA